MSELRGVDRRAHARRCGPDAGGGLEIEHRLDRLELDDHPLQAIGGMGLGIGHHDRQRLAGVEDLFAGQRLKRAAAPLARHGEVVGGEHRDHSGRLQRGRCVDRSDRRVRLVGEHQAGVQQPR